MSVPWTRVERLRTDHHIDSFDCGRRDITSWLLDSALEQDRRGAVTTWVCLKDDKVIGYYALTMTTITVPSDMSNTRRRKWNVGADDHAPAHLIAKLGLDTRFQRAGHGAELLHLALSTCLAASDLVSCNLVCVDAADDRLIGFYEKAGFHRLADRRLIVTSNALRKRFGHQS